MGREQALVTCQVVIDLTKAGGLVIAHCPCLDTREYHHTTVEIRNVKGQRLLVVGAYRPDSDNLYNFMPNLDYRVSNAYLMGFSNIIVTGDFNKRNIK